MFRRVRNEKRGEGGGRMAEGGREGEGAGGGRESDEEKRPRIGSGAETGARGRSEAAEGGAFGGEEKTSVPCERLSLNFIRDADNTRFRRELRDSCFIREGKRRCAPCIEFQCSLVVDGSGSSTILVVGKFEFPFIKDQVCRVGKIKVI